MSGNGAFVIAAPLLAASLTQDPAAVSVVTAAAYLPWLLFGMPAGALADRFPHRTVMVYADLSRAAVLVVLCAVLVAGHITITVLVVAVLLISTAQCFFDAASPGIIPAVVGRDKHALEKVNGRYWSLDVLGLSLVGPLIGAWTFTVGRVLPFAVDALSFVVSAIFVCRLPKPLPRAEREREPVFGAMRTGIGYIYRSPELLVLVLGMGAYNLGYHMSAATLVLYTRQELQVGAVGFGALFAPLAVGAALAGWFGTRLIRHRQASQVHAAALAGHGLSWLLVAVFAEVWTTAVLMGCIGAVSVLSTTACSSAFQRLAPEDGIGRVAAAFQVSSLSAGGIGALLGGWVASGFGLSAPMVAAAIWLFGASVAMWRVRHGVRRPVT